MTYTHERYPKHLYHPEEGTRVVHSDDEHKELGEGWYESPTDFPEKQASAENGDDIDTSQESVENPAENRQETADYSGVQIRSGLPKRTRKAVKTES